MDYQEESGTYEEACGDYGSDSITSFWNIKACELQKQNSSPYRQTSRNNKVFMSDWGFNCVLMPNGQAVLCNGFTCSVQITDSDKLKVVFNINFRSSNNEESVTYEPYGMALLDKDRVIVSVPSVKVLQPISITPHVQLEEEMTLKIAQYDVICRNRKIYVSTDDLNEWSAFICGGIQVLSLHGEVLQNIHLFERPRRFCVDHDGVILLTQTKLKQCPIRQLKDKRGIKCAVCDDEGNIMMSSLNEVLVAKSGSQETKTLIKEEKTPYSVYQNLPQHHCRIAFSLNQSDNSRLCYNMAIHYSSGYIAHQSSQLPSFMWKKYKLDM